MKRFNELDAKGDDRTLAEEIEYLNMRLKLYPEEFGKAAIREENLQEKELEIVNNNFTVTDSKDFDSAEFRNLAIIIMYDCPNCRERSLALTKLEECSDWARKAIERG